jgi:Tol biopolymer transport system component
VAPTSTTAAATETTAAPDESVAGDERATAGPAPDPGDGGIGSALDLGPGPVETRTPAPCVPYGQLTTAESLVVIEPANGCVRVLASQDEHVSKEVTWAPDGSWLLTTIELNVTRIAADGSWRQSLGGGGQAESASLSPDGQRIAVTGNVPCCYLDERKVLVVANADGTDAQLAQYNIGSVNEAPVWSPDSQRFAFVNTPRAVVGPWTPMTLHVFSAGGTELASRSFENRGASDAQTGDVHPGLIGHPGWTSGGGLVAPVVIQQPSSKSLYWFNADLSDASGPDNPEVLAYSGVATSSPDGGRVLYQGHDRDNGNFITQIWLLNRSDGSTSKLVQDATAPSWSPDGTHFAYATIDTASSQPQVAKTITIGDLQGNPTPTWTVDNFHCYCWLFAPPVWSPDGGRLAVTTR